MTKRQSKAGNAQDAEPCSRRAFVSAAAGILIVTLLLFGDALFTSRDKVLSAIGTDLSSQFVYWRHFGFSQLRHGNLALWNPHVFSGAPFLGGFQSALLYPPNYLYLVLPLVKAINIGIALHVFLAGLFMYLWTAHRGLRPLACFTSAVLFMLGAPHFLHIYPGHLPNLCAMAWAPLLFLAIDGIFAKRTLDWCLLGIFAVAMLVLAGHPQYAYYTAIAVAIYCALRVVSAQQRLKIVVLLAAVLIGSVALTSAQLFTGLEATRESIRSGKLPFEYAAMFSFPPENLLTLLAPGFFGDMRSQTYWGRCYLWETSLFLA